MFWRCPPLQHVKPCGIFQTGTSGRKLPSSWYTIEEDSDIDDSSGRQSPVDPLPIIPTPTPAELVTLDDNHLSIPCQSYPHLNPPNSSLCTTITCRSLANHTHTYTRRTRHSVRQSPVDPLPIIPTPIPAELVTLYDNHLSIPCQSHPHLHPPNSSLCTTITYRSLANHTHAYTRRTRHSGRQSPVDPLQVIHTPTPAELVTLDDNPLSIPCQSYPHLHPPNSSLWTTIPPSIPCQSYPHLHPPNSSLCTTFPCRSPANHTHTYTRRTRHSARHSPVDPLPIIPTPTPAELVTLYDNPLSIPCQSYPHLYPPNSSHWTTITCRSPASHTHTYTRRTRHSGRQSPVDPLPIIPTPKPSELVTLNDNPLSIPFQSYPHLHPPNSSHWTTITCRSPASHTHTYTRRTRHSGRQSPVDPLPIIPTPKPSELVTLNDNPPSIPFQSYPHLHPPNSSLWTTITCRSLANHTHTYTHRTRHSGRQSPVDPLPIIPTPKPAELVTLDDNPPVDPLPIIPTPTPAELVTLDDNPPSIPFQSYPHLHPPNSSLWTTIPCRSPASHTHTYTRRTRHSGRQSPVDPLPIIPTPTPAELVTLDDNPLSIPCKSYPHLHPPNSSLWTTIPCRSPASHTHTYTRRTRHSGRQSPRRSPANHTHTYTRRTRHSARHSPVDPLPIIPTPTPAELVTLHDIPLSIPCQSYPHLHPPNSSLCTTIPCRSPASHTHTYTRRTRHTGRQSPVDPLPVIPTPTPAELVTLDDNPLSIPCQSYPHLNPPNSSLWTTIPCRSPSNHTHTYTRRTRHTGRQSPVDPLPVIPTPTPAELVTLDDNPLSIPCQSYPHLNPPNSSLWTTIPRRSPSNHTHTYTRRTRHSGRQSPVDPLPIIPTPTPTELVTLDDNHLSIPFQSYPHLNPPNSSLWTTIPPSIPFQSYPHLHPPNSSLWTTIPRRSPSNHTHTYTRRTRHSGRQSPVDPLQVIPTPTPAELVTLDDNHLSIPCQSYPRLHPPNSSLWRQGRARDKPGQCLQGGEQSHPIARHSISSSNH